MRDAEQADMPSQVDSNSPAFWREGRINLLNSTGGIAPIRSSGFDQLHLDGPASIQFNHYNPWPTWIEAVWVEPVTGTIFAWYHQEHWGVCPGSRLAVPEIGAAISYDSGSSFHDLGAVLQSGDTYDCSSQNGYFAGGVGDFSVILDRRHEYFYFMFSNYAGDVETQGVAIARLAFADRYNPSGNVWKYFEGDWSQPGLRGRVTPIFSAKSSWQNADTDAMWGPSVHWNTYLDSYVMLLNHSCCSPGFPQEGIYISYNNDLSNPSGWKTPRRLLKDSGWYPQVLGYGPTGTDRTAGRTARLWIYGHSRWEIVFQKPFEPPPPPPTEQ